MKRLHKKYWQLLTASVASGAFYLLASANSDQIGSDGALAVMALALFIGVLSAIIGMVFLYFDLAARPIKSEKAATSGWVPRLLAALTLISIVTGMFCAIRTLNVDPEAGKFIYNGIANTAAAVTILLIYFLSAVQKNMYWISRKLASDFDERQVRERQRVLEISYRIGAIVLLLSAYMFSTTKDALPRIVNDFTNFGITPGALFLPFYNLAFLFFALPLIVAAWSTIKSNRK